MCAKHGLGSKADGGGGSRPLENTLSKHPAAGCGLRTVPKQVTATDNTHISLQQGAEGCRDPACSITSQPYNDPTMPRHRLVLLLQNEELSHPAARSAPLSSSSSTQNRAPSSPPGRVHVLQTPQASDPAPSPGFQLGRKNTQMASKVGSSNYTADI